MFPSVVKLTGHCKYIKNPSFAVVTIVLDIKFCHVVLAFGKIRFCDLKRKDQSYKVIVESESQGTGIFEKEKMPESGIPFVEPATILIDPDKIFEAAPVIVYIFRFFGIVIIV